MAIEGNWGFDEADDWEPERARPVEPVAHGPTGHDRAGSVTVVVEPDGGAAAVRLAPGWRDTVGPRGLGPAVTEAVAAATVAAMAHAVPRPDPPPRPAPRGAADEPLSLGDATRLLGAALAELDSHAATVDAATRRVEAVESGGGHVRATARAGQVTGVEVDLAWAARSRDGEIESELADALRRAHDRTAPEPALTGPAGPALTEIRALTADPHTLLRRIGLTR